MPDPSRTHLVTIMCNGQVVLRDWPIPPHLCATDVSITDAAVRKLEHVIGKRPGCYRLQVRGPRVTLSLTEDIVAPAPAGQQTPWRKVPSWAS